MTPSLRTVPLHSQETARSFVSRLAAANGLPAMGDFCRDMRVSLSSLCAGDPAAIGALAELGQAKAEAMLANAIVRRDEGSWLGQLKLERKHSGKSLFRYCPRCLVEDMDRNGNTVPAVRPWLRVHWSVGAVRTCPKHHCLLVRENFGVPKYLCDDVAAVCRLHGDGIRRLADEAKTLPASHLERYLAQRIEGAEDASDLLGTLPFFVGIKLCEMVGASVLFGRKFTWKRFSPAEQVAAGSAGYEVVSGGLEALKAFLTPLYDEWSRSKALSAKGLGGGFFVWLQESRRNPDVDGLRELLRDHAMECLPIGPGDMFLGPVTAPRKLHSVYSAHLEHGIHPKRLKKLLVQEGFIEPEASKASDVRIVFDAVATQELLEAAADEIIGNDARDHLGMTRVQWREIRNAGLVMPLFGNGDGTYLSYSKAGLEAFLANVRYEKGVGGELVSLPRCIKLASCRYVDIVRLLQTGALDRVSFDPKRDGFAGVLVDASEVAAKTPRPELPGMTARQAAVRIGVVLDTVHALIANDDLPSIVHLTYGGGGRETRLVQPEDVEAFAAEYVPLKELAAMIGAEDWPRRARMLMDEMGIEPAFTLATHRTVIYRRNDAEAAVRNSLSKDTQTFQDYNNPTGKESRHHTEYDSM